ncbi:MAG TPA: response regulator [Chitinophagaceae bacterium]|nr:response regulator [Chitinophagaceae bacterium]
MKNILLIDEDTFFISSIGYFLENEGYNITACSNGQSGIEMLSKETIDLVICSTQLRIKNGFEVAEYIKSNYEFAAIPVILISPSNSIVSVKLEDEIFYDDYIQKPVLFVSLLEKVHNLLSRKLHALNQ